MKVLMTGISGRFGPYLADELLAYGHEVVLFSRQKPALAYAGLEWIKGDVNQIEDCLLAFQGRSFAAVLHAAAVPSPTDAPYSQQKDDPAFFPLTMQTNIMGLYNMLQASLRHDVGIFVQTGSNCALGHGYRISGRTLPVHYLPFDEKHPSDAEDSYSFSKLAGEQLLASYSKAYGMRCYALRAAGIRNEAERQAMAREAVRQSSWSDWMYPWIASEDLASAHRLLLEKSDQLPLFASYFCNNDDSTLLEKTLDLLERFRPDLLDKARPELLSGHASLFSAQALKDAVGWQPQESWRQYLL